MTVSLTVDRTRWSAHLHHTLEQIRAVATPVPVVKGNGYGFGRHALAKIAAEESTTICVGTIHELDGLPDSLTPVVLTPTLAGPTPSAILTVSNEEHVTPLVGSAQRVIIKLASSMHRYGGSSSLVQHALDGGLDVAGVAIHLPLIATDDERVAEVNALLDPIPTSIPAWLSHIDPSLIASLPDSRTYLLRAGTTLWHGDRGALHLSTDVIDLRPVRAGDHAGYRRTDVIEDGHLVMVGAGSAHGVHPLADGRSPFHFNRQRVDMFEPPHMHTTMLFIPRHTAPPAIGDTIDLQRPLTQTIIDEVIWV
ncbi:MAG: alanine racemase [Actinomycetota bacterium]|nr:alanine racemase [Actinomycetota bacterium]